MSSDHLAKIFTTSQQGVNENHLDIALNYPYCSIAQFYFLQHAKKNSLPEFEQQTERTALYFSNINWLNWQLHLYTKPDSIRDNAAQKSISDYNTTIPTKVENIEPRNVEEDVDMPDLSGLSAQMNNTDEEIVAFEPLHTVDYFASQGIKITDEVINNDKLGTQLKSFTEWLKSMKNIHVQKFPESSKQTDNKIQNIAEDSNIQSGVLTEAMAQVLVKQNKLEKAIEMYSKLSLINPSKSAYFADKIASLKPV